MLEILAVNPWTPVAAEAVKLLILIAGPVLAAVFGWAGLRLAKKLGMQNQDILREKFEHAALLGVAKAEQWARTQSGKPAGPSKKAEAVKFALQILQDEKIVAVARSKIEDMIEAQLGRTGISLKP